MTGYKKQKRTLGSYPGTNIVLSTMFALFVIGLLGLMLLHAQKLTLQIREHVKVQVYLNRKVPAAEKKAIYTYLMEQDFVFNKDGYPQVVFIDKNQAAKRFIQQTRERFWEVLDENPLRDHPAPSNVMLRRQQAVADGEPWQDWVRAVM